MADKKETRYQLNKKTALINIITILIFAALILLFFYPELTRTEPIEPAKIELAWFDDPHDNHTMRIEFWIENKGDIRATDISVFVRSRNAENGTIYFSDEVPVTAVWLDGDDEATGVYSFDFNATACDEIYHTFEVSWNAGRNSYLEVTIL